MAAYPLASVTEAQDVVVLTVAGEIDILSAPSFQGSLYDAYERAHAADHKLVVDLRGVPYMDSTGFHVLANVYARRPRVREHGFAVVATGIVKHVLVILSDSGMFPVCDTLDEALSALRSGSR